MIIWLTYIIVLHIFESFQNILFREWVKKDVCAFETSNAGISHFPSWYS